MAARYVYRMDDITPEMHWKRFNEYICLFRSHNVKPLLGIVPDNRDPDLVRDKASGSFWETMRYLKAADAADFAQHGYRHQYMTEKTGLINRMSRFSNKSEFYGLPYAEQFEMIRKGREILLREGISTDIWMAPSHSYDTTTLKVLRDLGFKYVTDGIALYPYRKCGLTFLPVQHWWPEKCIFGCITVCIHSNESIPGLLEELDRHLHSGAHAVSFYQAALRKPLATDAVVNTTYKVYYLLRRNLRPGRLLRKLRGITSG